MENTTTNPEMEPSNGADQTGKVVGGIEHAGDVPVRIEGTGELNPFIPVTDLDEAQTRTIKSISTDFSIMANFLVTTVPVSHQRQVALDALLTAKFMAVQAVTHG